MYCKTLLDEKTMKCKLSFVEKLKEIIYFFDRLKIEREKKENKTI